MKLLRTFVPTEWKAIPELSECIAVIKATPLEYSYLKGKYDLIWKENVDKTMMVTVGYFTKSYPITLTFKFVTINQLKVAFYEVTSDINYTSAVENYLKVAYGNESVTDALNFNEVLDYIRNQRVNDDSDGITYEVLKKMSPEDCEALAKGLYPDYDWKFIKMVGDNEWEGHDLVAGKLREDGTSVASMQIDYRPDAVSGVARVRFYKDSLTQNLEIPDYLSVYSILKQRKLI